MKWLRRKKKETDLVALHLKDQLDAVKRELNSPRAKRARTARRRRRGE